MKKKKDGEDSIEITSGGQTVKMNAEGLKAVANEMKTRKAVIAEAGGQINSLIGEWMEMIWKTYKANGNEMDVSLKLQLKGNSEEVDVKSSISFNTGKIGDSRDALLRLNQLPLPIGEGA